MIAERRGEWTYVLLAGPRTERYCLMPEGLVGDENPVEHRDGRVHGGHSTARTTSRPPRPRLSDLFIESQS